ncbi:S8 family serine peptidase [Carboxylicivirga sp. RSCT41]|uniref:S8 family serine peptidase n=1 Tax=Carboxylicivirga agarovorans TaxID=3417570 RepID=UPI003D3364B4
MKNNLQKLRILSLLLSWMFMASAIHGQSIDNHTIPGVLRVKLKPELLTGLKGMSTTHSNGVVTTGIQAFDNANRVYSVSEMKRVIPYNARYDAKHRKHELHLWYELKFSSDISPMEAAETYKRLADVTVAQPIYKKQLISGSKLNLPVPAAANSGSSSFTDTYLADQWHYNNTGDVAAGAIAGADINLFKAWEIETGKSNVIVSIVDGGFQTNHVDLVDNVWVNEAELKGEAGVDDDGNGYVDDIHGWNFVKNSANIEAHYHGTHVAGTVAATNNNGKGVAGVAGGSGNGDGVRIQSAQIFTEDGYTPNIAAAIIYGADNGAVISQNSWGYTSPDTYDQVVLDAIDYFIEEAGDYAGSPMKGGVVIFAAGNQSVGNAMYPGYYEPTIAVAAIKADNQIASYSNYGDYIDIASYGGDLDVAQNAAVMSTYPGNTYAFLDGTSMACPHVSGIAALVVSKYGSDSFTAEDLKQHLLTGVRDVDSFNPDYVGKLGYGISDAVLALANDEGIAPDAIQNLELLGLGQDFADLKWTVPADQDDAQPVMFEVYYHTANITSENINQADKVELKSKAAADAEVLQTVEGLDATTTYYFAVRSIDRWGNVSELSNSVNGTTNEGPDIHVEEESITVTADALVSPIGTGSFTILNQDEGILEWNGMVRHTTNRLSSYSRDDYAYPKVTARTSATEIGMFKVFDVAPLNNLPIQTSEVSMASEYNEIHYGIEGYNYMIGDIDTTITNSAATRFYVDSINGFNLTSVQMFLEHRPITGPMIMEIYVGEQLHRNNLTAVVEYNHNDAMNRWHTIRLDEQIFMEHGTTFWTVIHVPSGNEFPLGIMQETNQEYSDNCFMSFDVGTTWEPLAPLIEDDRWVWSMVANSSNTHLGNYVTLKPANGKVIGNESQVVELEVDGTYLANGSYNSNVLIKSNDKDEKEYRVPLSFTIEGHNPVLVNEKIIDFGTVFYGHEKELTFYVENHGYGNWVRSSITSSDPQFVIDRKPYSIKARQSGSFTIIYTPDGSGNDNSTITMEDKKGNVHTINLFGVGITPPEMEVSPLTQDAGTINVGEETTASVTIANNGEYPLDYAMPLFANDINIENVGRTHKYGYVYETNLDGDPAIAYYWEDIAATGNDLSEFFKVTTNSYYEVGLGFEYLFYGQGIENMYITKAGMLSLTNTRGYANCSPPKVDGCTPDGWISAVNLKFELAKGGSIHYENKPGKLVVQYTDVVLKIANSINEKVTFQIVVHQNGDIDYIFKDIENMDSYSRRYLMVGVGDIGNEDPFLITGRYTSSDYIRLSIVNETIFRLKSPGQRLVKKVSSAQGVVNPGESVDIELTINTDGLYEADMFQKLAVVSNDPFNSLQFFEVTTSIVGGEADLFLLNESIDFGSIYQGGTINAMAAIKNGGTKGVDITAATLQTGENFTITGELPYALNAKGTFFVHVSLNTDTKGSFEDVLTFETGDGETYQVNLSGEVTAAPGIAVDVTPITETLNAGESINKTISVTNDGEADLDVLTHSTDWLYANKISAASNDHIVQDFTYSAMTTNMDGGPAYSWEDIVVPGEGINGGNYWLEVDPFWYPIELPFEFTYWGEPTNKIWVSWEGVITTKEPTHSPYWILPKPFPTEDDLNSLIAPFFGAHSESKLPDWPGYDKVGVFHKIYDDRIVITWSEYVDMFTMGSPFSFQAILYKNGNIKFQYDTEMRSYVSAGILGLENHDGKEAVQLMSYAKFIEDEMAISFVPSTKHVVAPGTSVDIDVMLDATHLNKGVYEGSLLIESDAPMEEEMAVPVTLTVEGEAGLSTVDGLHFGDIIAYQRPNDYEWVDVIYEKSFTIVNDGHDVLTLNMVNMQNGTTAELQMEKVDWMWGNKFWAPLSPWDFPLEIVPGQKKEFKLVIAPNAEEYEIDDNVQIFSNYPGDEVLIPVTASVKLPAVFEYPNETVSFLANTKESTGSETVTISNANGLSPLTYDITFNFSRAGAESEMAAASLMNNASETLPIEMQQLEITPEAANKVAPYADAYNSVLEYVTGEDAEGAVGFGEDRALIAGISFTAPAEGFNLSHVKTWYNYQTILNSTVKVEIRAGGGDVSVAQILYSEDFTVNVDEANAQEKGEWMTFKLAENQLFYPGEEFYVLFHYQEGVGYPQGIHKGIEQKAKRYFMSLDDGWYDLQLQNGFETSGWAMKACEETAADISWAKLDGELSGEVAVGETLDLKIDFYAANAQEADNNGNMVITTNDPMKTSGTVPLYMRLNQGPEYDVEGGMSHIVNENETLSINITGSDYEGDACTYALAEEYTFAEMSVNGDDLQLSVSPDYESAGVYTVTVKGTDVHNNVSTCELSIEVANVNRTPEVLTPIEDTEIVLEHGIVEYNLNDYIADADMDDLVFDATGTDASLLELFLSEDRMIMEPLMPGTSTVTVVASDIEGASVNHTFNVTVIHRTGIDELEGARISTYPNPVADLMTIEWDHSVLKEVSFRLVNITGDVVRAEEVADSMGKHQMVVDDLANGIYLLEMISEGEKLVKKIVIQN